MASTDRVNFLFADGRALYDDAIEMLDQGKIRNAAEKAWGATKRATDALVLARHGEEPQSAGLARRALLRFVHPRPSVRREMYCLRAMSPWIPVLWSIAQPPYLSARFTRLMSSNHEPRSSSVRSAA